MPSPRRYVPITSSSHVMPFISLTPCEEAAVHAPHPLPGLVSVCDILPTHSLVVMTSSFALTASLKMTPLVLISLYDDPHTNIDIR